MWLFDKLKNVFSSGDSKTNNTSNTSSYNSTNTSASKPQSNVVSFTFNELPQSLEDLKRLSEASLDTPFKTAALAILSFCVYSKNKEEGIKMINFLRGPKGSLLPSEIQFYDDRFKDNGKYVPFSYFKGATPETEYEPSKPYTLEFYTDSHSYEQATYCKLNTRSNGADSSRQIMLRVASGKWYLWEQYVLVGIRVPKSQNPWG